MPSLDCEHRAEALTHGGVVGRASDRNRSMSKVQSQLRTLLDAVAPHRDAVERHPLYVELTSLERIHVFMEHHVFAVWDFMCLLKALQRRLTSPTVPWLPVGDPQTRRLINEIVLGEESDELPDGRVLSHFELYREAMTESGADLSTAAAFEQGLKQGRPVRVALREVGVPAAAREFVTQTLDIVEQDRPHLIAAVFTVGREQMIPRMFVKIVRALADTHPGKLETFKLYLERHIELDQSEHGPLAAQMMQNLCGCDRSRWEEATSAAISALEGRRRLWDAVLEKVAAL